MKIPSLLAALMAVTLGSCTHDALGARNYAGSPGSVYDATRNPPQAQGVVTYDPASPLLPHDYGNGVDSTGKL